jgi:4-hydroxythreonine-4-phosphate dehydrogenase
MPLSNIADRLPPLALALGDPAGVGPEIAAKAWERRAAEGLLPFFVVGDVRSIEAVWSGPIARISDPSEAWEAFGTALPLIQLEDAGEIIPGAPNVAGARCSLDSLELAVGLARSGAASVIARASCSASHNLQLCPVLPGGSIPHDSTWLPLNPQVNGTPCGAKSASSGSSNPATRSICALSAK